MRTLRIVLRILPALLALACALPFTRPTAVVVSPAVSPSPPVGVTSSPLSPLPTASPSTAVPTGAAGRLMPTDFTYLGAFRLPGEEERPRTFAYGGNAMTFRPDGDAGGPPDGFPGSLFISAHDRLPYGELPDGSQVAEVDIPAPVITRSPGALNQAGFLQDFHNIAAGLFPTLAEIPRIGLQYLDTPATGPRIHLAWGQHFQEDEQTQAASHAWFSPQLNAPQPQGPWFIGQQSPYSVNGYLFEIPAEWAAQHTGGRPLATGRFKDGGWSGMGPALFAYRPWLDDGQPAPAGAHLQEMTLLLYQSSRQSETIERALVDYQHADEWEGGAWITTPGGRTAVLFAGTKGVGARYWYGFRHPAGPNQPCIFEEYVEQYTMCRLAGGEPCPAEDLHECRGHTSERGWWSSRFVARFLLYDPAALAKVAAGQLQPWEPQPYAWLDIDEHLFLNPAGVEEALLGRGVQRRYRLGDVSYDRRNGLLYVLELFADQAKPVVHVWRLR